MQLTENKLTTILYEKLNGENTARVIIPTKVPADQITAIDVSDLTPIERERVQRMYEEYSEYVKTHMSTMFKFNEWIDHTYGESVDEIGRAHV